MEYVLIPALSLIIIGFILRKLHNSSKFEHFYTLHPLIKRIVEIFGIVILHTVTIFVSVYFALVILIIDNLGHCSLFQNRDYIMICEFFLIFYGTISLLFRKRSFFVYLVLYILCFVSLPFTSFFPTKPLYRSYYRFEPGMTVEEVTGIMQEEFGKAGFKMPTLDHVGEDYHFYILDPDDGSWDWWWIQIYFKDNRYQRTKFSPD